MHSQSLKPLITALIVLTASCDKKSSEGGAGAPAAENTPGPSPGQPSVIPPWTGEQTGAARSLCESKPEQLPDVPREIVPAVCGCLVTRASARWPYAEGSEEWKSRLETLRTEGALTSCRVEPIYGTWETPCFKLTKDGVGAKTRWVIGPETMVAHHLNYLDDTCKTMGFRITESFRSAVRLEADGDFYVDLTRTKAVKKYGDVGQALLASLGAEYDHKDWPVWKDLDIADRQRAREEMPDYPLNERRYDRYRVVGDRLYTGLRTDSTGDGRTPDKRTKEVFPDLYHQRKIEGEAGPEALASGNGRVERDVGGSGRWRPSLTDPDGDDLTIECEGACPEGFRVENNELVFDAGRPGETNVRLTARDTGGRTATVTAQIAVYKTFTAYLNADGDARGEGAAVTLRLTRQDLPTSHAAAGGDCAPGDATKWQTAYRDMDGDGYTYGAWGSLCVGAAVPAGYTTTERGNDCSDMDPTRWQLLPYAHRDMDGDGYTVPTTPAALCVGAALPASYLTEEVGPDCDDTNTARKHLVAHYYLDRDGNGLGVPGPGLACTGNPLPYLPYRPRAPDPAEHHPSSLAAGGSHACLLHDNGGVKCWGLNNYGQLGDGTALDKNTPVALVDDLPSEAVQIVAKLYRTCALTDTGAVECWGYNYNGQIGDGTNVNKSVPTQVIGLNSGVVQIASGGDHACALLVIGSVKCWGNNYYGQLGDGTTTLRYLPTQVAGLSDGVVQIAAGGDTTCALLNTGGVKCWGRNDYGQIGDGSTYNRSYPTQVSGLTSDVLALTVGTIHTCSILASGAVKCWGSNYYGQIGDGTPTNRSTPTNVTGLASGVADISAGDLHTCAMLNTGGVKCWGYNTQGQLGDGTTIQRNTPTQVNGLTSGVTGIAAGVNHTCALLNTGGVKCWGYNYNGQLGNGTTTQSNTPVDVTGL